MEDSEGPKDLFKLASPPDGYVRKSVDGVEIHWILLTHTSEFQNWILLFTPEIQDTREGPNLLYEPEVGEYVPQFFRIIKVTKSHRGTFDLPGVAFLPEIKPAYHVMHPDQVRKLVPGYDRTSYDEVETHWILLCQTDKAQTWLLAVTPAERTDGQQAILLDRSTGLFKTLITQIIHAKRKKDGRYHIPEYSMIMEIKRPEDFAN